MRRILTLLSLIVLFTGCVASTPAVQTPARPDYLDAVKPIQIKTPAAPEELILMLKAQEWTLDAEGFSNICTATHINDQYGYWLTAAHCLVEIGPEGRYIMSQPAEVVAISTDMDLAVFRVEGVHTKVLKLSKEPMYVEQDLIIAGHPFGYKDLYVTKGWVSNPGILLDKFYCAFNVTGAPGNSGSPVMNSKGEIVSVLQIGWGRVFSPMTGGATSEYMKWVAPYFTGE